MGYNEYMKKLGSEVHRILGVIAIKSFYYQILAWVKTIGNIFGGSK